MADRGGVVFLGTPDFAVASLRALVESGERVELVVTQPDRRRGRAREPQPPTVKSFAVAHGIEVVQPESVRAPEFLERFTALGAEVAIVAAYGQILPRAMLDAPTHGCLNVHASLLPRFRGASPIQHAILEGDSVTGVTIMQMDEGLDTGGMLWTRELPILPEDTAGTLHDRLAELGAEALTEALGRLRRGELSPVKQDDSQASYASMLRKSDGVLDWQDSAEQIQRRIAAMHPWPGAQTSLDGLRLKIHPPIAWEGGAHDAVPGTVIEVADAGIRVACGEGSVSLFELQLEGRRRMPVAQFLRGFPLEAGVRLGEVS